MQPVRPLMACVTPYQWSGMSAPPKEGAGARSGRLQHGWVDLCLLPEPILAQCVLSRESGTGSLRGHRWRAPRPTSGQACRPGPSEGLGRALAACSMRGRT